MAAVCGLAYFWFVYFRRGAGARAGAPVFSPEIGAFVPLVILGYLAWIWLLGADTSALTFTPAEVMALATERGITTVAITDHDTTKGWADARTAADAAGIEFILPIGRWLGYGGVTDRQGMNFETMTWAAAVLAALIAVHTLFVVWPFAASSAAVTPFVPSQPRKPSVQTR